ncbi:COG3904 family protein [Sphingosinicella rhizophila]|uniref:ATP-dependent Clp protease proteolytic subunit n=1 Tax=Sphingosinicella rhizophila TaxID=3050082 RepID=A0ABU3Q312_9SPHN|nr:hypothetical protein [Sphingosinicella sp. GR2756]MDT9597791.1 hypothetical protein [Sphingosinicella sp. GR2756]
MIMRQRSLAFLSAVALLWSTGVSAANDPKNPTCPQPLNWGDAKPMRLTVQQRDDKKVLLAEGMVDDGLLQRFTDTLEKEGPVDEIWFRSPGGNARIGNQVGMLIRKLGIPTRIPSGWACFSACNFLFMGGFARSVDPGGLFVVHMFTHTGNRSAIEAEVMQGTDNTVGLIGEIEQESALLASEDNDFLIRMGISRKLLTDVMYQQKAVAESGSDASTRRCLTQDEVRRYNVVTKVY